MKYLIISFVFIFFGCKEDPNRPLTVRERQFADSLMVNHKKIWATYYDSLCQENMQSLVDFYYDSLLQEEIKSIQKLEE